MRRLRRVAKAHVGATQPRLSRHRADGVKHLQVEDLERTLEQQSEVRPVVGVAAVVVWLAPHLAAVHAAQRVVDGVVDHEVPRRVARLPVGGRHVPQHVEQLAATAPARPVGRSRSRKERQPQAALQAEAECPGGQAERLVLGHGIEEGAGILL